MLPTVELDHKSKPMAGEVGEVRTDGGLTTEVVLLERWLAQMLPEFLFGFGGVATRRASPWHAAV